MTTASGHYMRSSIDTERQAACLGRGGSRGRIKHARPSSPPNGIRAPTATTSAELNLTRSLTASPQDWHMVSPSASQCPYLALPVPCLTVPPSSSHPHPTDYRPTILSLRAEAITCTRDCLHLHAPRTRTSRERPVMSSSSLPPIGVSAFRTLYVPFMPSSCQSGAHTLFTGRVVSRYFGPAVASTSPGFLYKCRMKLTRVPQP